MTSEPVYAGFMMDKGVSVFLLKRKERLLLATQVMVPRLMESRKKFSVNNLNISTYLSFPCYIFNAYYCIDQIKKIFTVVCVDFCMPGIGNINAAGQQKI